MNPAPDCIFCAIVEGHVSSSANQMFKGAIKPVVGGLANLRTEIKGLLQKRCAQKLVGDLELNYGARLGAGIDRPKRPRATGDPDARR